MKEKKRSFHYKEKGYWIFRVHNIKFPQSNSLALQTSAYPFRDLASNFTYNLWQSWELWSLSIYFCYFLYLVIVDVKKSTLGPKIESFSVSPVQEDLNIPLPWWKPMSPSLLLVSVKSQSFSLVYFLVLISLQLHLSKTLHPKLYSSVILNVFLFFKSTIF